jgi:hypothetical protein
MANARGAGSTDQATVKSLEEICKQSNAIKAEIAENLNLFNLAVLRDFYAYVQKNDYFTIVSALYEKLTSLSNEAKRLCDPLKKELEAIHKKSENSLKLDMLTKELRQEAQQRKPDPEKSKNITNRIIELKDSVSTGGQQDPTRQKLLEEIIARFAQINSNTKESEVTKNTMALSLQVLEDLLLKEYSDSVNQMLNNFVRQRAGAASGAHEAQRSPSDLLDQINTLVFRAPTRSFKEKLTKLSSYIATKMQEIQKPNDVHLKKQEMLLAQSEKKEQKQQKQQKQQTVSTQSKENSSEQKKLIEKVDHHVGLRKEIETKMHNLISEIKNDSFDSYFKSLEKNTDKFNQYNNQYDALSSQAEQMMRDPIFNTLSKTPLIETFTQDTSARRKQIRKMYSEQSDEYYKRLVEEFITTYGLNAGDVEKLKASRDSESAVAFVAVKLDAFENGIISNFFGQSIPGKIGAMKQSLLDLYAPLVVKECQAKYALKDETIKKLKESKSLENALSFVVLKLLAVETRINDDISRRLIPIPAEIEAIKKTLEDLYTFLREKRDEMDKSIINVVQATSTLNQQHQQTPVGSGVESKLVRQPQLQPQLQPQPQPQPQSQPQSQPQEQLQRLELPLRADTTDNATMADRFLSELRNMNRPAANLEPLPAPVITPSWISSLISNFSNSLKRLFASCFGSSRSTESAPRQSSPVSDSQGRLSGQNTVKITGRLVGGTFVTWSVPSKPSNSQPRQRLDGSQQGIPTVSPRPSVSDDKYGLTSSEQGRQGPQMRR